MTFTITAQGDFSTPKAASDLYNFLQKEIQQCGLEIMSFSRMPLAAVIAIPQDRKHHLRIALNIFAAETEIDWKMESD